MEALRAWERVSSTAARHGGRRWVGEVRFEGGGKREGAMLPFHARRAGAKQRASRHPSQTWCWPDDWEDNFRHPQLGQKIIGIVLRLHGHQISLELWEAVFYYSVSDPASLTNRLVVGWYEGSPELRLQVIGELQPRTGFVPGLAGGLELPSLNSGIKSPVSSPVHNETLGPRREWKTNVVLSFNCYS